MPGARRAGGTALRIILASLFKNWRRILASMAAILALTLVFVVIVKPSYVANSTLLVLLSSEYSPRAVGDDAKSSSIVLERDAILKNEVEILTSSALEKETLRKIGLERVYPDYLKPPGLFARIKASLSDRFQGLLASLGAPSPPAQVVDPSRSRRAAIRQGTDRDPRQGGQYHRRQLPQSRPRRRRQRRQYAGRRLSGPAAGAVARFADGGSGRTGRGSARRA